MWGNVPNAETYIGLLFVLSISFWFLNWLSTKSKCDMPVKVMAVLGSGGHTREMISVMKNLSSTVFSPRVYVYCKNDHLSKLKAEEMEAIRGNNNVIFTSIPRSREVGQSYITSVFTTAYSMFESFAVVLTALPDVIICTGPGVCVPIIYSAIFLKMLGVKRTRIVFVESICRVNSLSLTGKLVFPVASEFLVQWEEMQDKFKGSKYIGRLC